MSVGEAEILLRENFIKLYSLFKMKNISMNYLILQIKKVLK